MVETGLIIRLIGDIIVIDRDNNNKPLVDALVHAGVLRERIVLAYAGESIPLAAYATPMCGRVHVALMGECLRA